MKRITLENIYDALREMRHEVHVAADVASRARTAIERMLALPRTDRPPGFATGAAPVEVAVMSRA
jgi:quinolinate synthase